jgi:hypothetical protein
VTREKLPNNVFAGRDGKVYRREDSGWKVNQGRTWHPAPPEMNPPAPPAARPGGISRKEPTQNWPPRFQRPLPAQEPSRTEPPRVEPPRPTPPPASPVPGNLEREFRGRARTNPGARPAPAREQKPGEKKQ